MRKANFDGKNFSSFSHHDEVFNDTSSIGTWTIGPSPGSGEQRQSALKFAKKCNLRDIALFVSKAKNQRFLSSNFFKQSGSEGARGLKI